MATMVEETLTDPLNNGAAAAAAAEVLKATVGRTSVPSAAMSGAVGDELSGSKALAT